MACREDPFKRKMERACLLLRVPELPEVAEIPLSEQVCVEKNVLRLFSCERSLPKRGAFGPPRVPLAPGHRTRGLNLDHREPKVDRPQRPMGARCRGKD